MMKQQRGGSARHPVSVLIAGAFAIVLLFICLPRLRAADGKPGSAPSTAATTPPIAPTSTSTSTAAVATKPASVTAVASSVPSSSPSTTQAAPLPDTRMRSPQEEMKTIVLPPGYRLELVASDPDLISPALCAWDGNGRMYVAEMRTYMLDINGVNALTPASRVSRWEDTKGNGVYDRHTVFADKLLLPRMILPLDDRILIRETGTKDIYSYRDSGGDGVADEKIRVYQGGKQELNLEHQPSGLIWNLDNWIYITRQEDRYRYANGKLERSSLPPIPGQWGIAMDNTGQMIFSTAGAERPAHNFQVMPQYGDINLPGEMVEKFTKVYPIQTLTDVEGGPSRLRPEGGVNRFTACGGGSIFRGDALPADVYGDYILPEPVGRLIRRAHVTNVNGKRVLSNAYDEKEFIASTDANFRPVWTATGPDGCLYICDMYHGIIQEAHWTQEGTYLRPQIQKYGLDKNINGGRIFRVVHDGMKRREQPRMLDETPEQLVRHLSDPNGWWRDTAQKLIIIRGDKTVAPKLKKMAWSDSNPIARLHALWTLEGLECVDRELLLEKLKDTDPRLRSAAVRIAESKLKNDPALLGIVTAVGNDSDPSVAAQVCLSLIYTQQKDVDARVQEIIKAGGRPDVKLVDVKPADVKPGDDKKGKGAKSADAKVKDGPENVVRDIVQRYRENIAKAKEAEEKKKAMEAANAQFAAVFEKGRVSYTQTCIACHGADGKGAPAPEKNGKTLAPSLNGSAKLLGDKTVLARLVLNGLTGPNDGKIYPGQMPSFKWADDEWLSSILTYARNEWGNKVEAVEPAVVAAIRKETASRVKPYTVEELLATTPPPPPPTTAPAGDGKKKSPTTAAAAPAKVPTSAPAAVVEQPRTPTANSSKTAG